MISSKNISRKILSTLLAVLVISGTVIGTVFAQEGASNNVAAAGEGSSSESNQSSATESTDESGDEALDDADVAGQDSRSDSAEAPAIENTGKSEDETLNDAAVVDQNSRSDSAKAHVIESTGESGDEALADDAVANQDNSSRRAEDSPHIKGPEWVRRGLLLPEGYVAISVGPYTVTGNPTPNVFLTGGDLNTSVPPEITWNDDTKMLDIAPGLVEGRYAIRVTAVASNGWNYYDIGFNLTVIKAPGSMIVGPKKRSIYTVGSATETETATSIGPYILIGDPKPTVILEGTVPPEITWNATTNMLDIAPGLSHGKYLFDLRASNNIQDDTLLHFELGVSQEIPPTGGGITITEIIGPTTMTLQEGYAATSTSRYTAYGLLPLTVSLNDHGHSNITLNVATKTLDIAPGLLAGVYKVELMANTGGDHGDFPEEYFNDKLEFTLTVEGTLLPEGGTGGGVGGGVGGGSGGGSGGSNSRSSDSGERTILSKISAIDHFGRMSYINETKMRFFGSLCG